jgi:hypothetical protein
MAIGALLDSAQLTPDQRGAIDALIEEKRAGGELGEGPRIEVLDDWICDCLAAADPQAVSEVALREDGAAAVQRYFLEQVGLPGLA